MYFFACARQNATSMLFPSLFMVGAIRYLGRRRTSHSSHRGCLTGHTHTHHRNAYILRFCSSEQVWFEWLQRFNFNRNVITQQPKEWTCLFMCVMCDQCDSQMSLPCVYFVCDEFWVISPMAPLDTFLSFRPQMEIAQPKKKGLAEKQKLQANNRIFLQTRERVLQCLIEPIITHGCNLRLGQSQNKQKKINEVLICQHWHIRNNCEKSLFATIINIWEWSPLVIAVKYDEICLAVKI